MGVVKAYPVKLEKLSGTKYSEVYKKAWNQYLLIQKHTKRRTYIRSDYFDKDKVFLSLFWQHLKDKFHHGDKVRRLKYFPCAIELLKHSRFAPTSKENVDKKSEILHRFTGMTPDNEIFFVQVKENKKNKQKYLISIFPLEK